MPVDGLSLIQNEEGINGGRASILKQARGWGTSHRVLKEQRERT